VGETDTAGKKKWRIVCTVQKKMWKRRSFAAMKLRREMEGRFGEWPWRRK